MHGEELCLLQKAFIWLINYLAIWVVAICLQAPACRALYTKAIMIDLLSTGHDLSSETSIGQ